jgi:hypothetical protein
MADYINALRRQHIENVLKAMIFEALQRNDLKFTRPYALLSLMSLGERSDPDEIFKRAEREGYEGTEEGNSSSIRGSRMSYPISLQTYAKQSASQKREKGSPADS